MFNNHEKAVSNIILHKYHMCYCIFMLPAQTRNEMQFFFLSESVIKYWNSLPSDVASVLSLGAFRSKLDVFLENMQSFSHKSLNTGQESLGEIYILHMQEIRVGDPKWLKKLSVNFWQ